MDRIYNHAGLIIVAAAGDDPTYGLPGVSLRSRKSRATIKLDETTFVNMAPDVSRNIRESTWATRAWTYQEGFLSRRRLIFTDYEVVFSCETGFHTDGILDSSLYAIITPGEGPFMDDVFPSSWVRRDPLYYCAAISRRRISYESDLLNALTGILTWVKNKHSSVHLAGVPAAIHLREEVVTFSLAWYHDQPGNRRDAYPSWSWLGWKDPPSTGLASEFDVIVGEVFQCSIVQADQALTPLQAYISVSLNPSIADTKELPRTLHITTTMLQPKFLVLDYGDEFGRSSRCCGRTKGIHVCLELTNRLTVLLCVYLDSPVEHVEDLSDCFAMVLPMMSSRQFCLLLVKPLGSRYSRVGIARDITDRYSQVPIVDALGRVSYVARWQLYAYGKEGTFKRPFQGYWANENFREQLWFQYCTKRTIVLE